MHILIVVLATAVFATGVLLNNVFGQNEIQNLLDSSDSPKVLNALDDKQNKPDSNKDSQENQNSQDNKEDRAQDSQHNPESPEVASLSNHANNTKQDNLAYPNSEKVSENRYKTSESADVVTQWYKDTFSSKGYNIKNFVTTSVNEEFENVLVVANEAEEIKVSITGSNGTETSILIEKTPQ